jgi:DNA-binding transcriptional MerR regulator
LRPAHTIRYYEKEGILPPIERDENGIRIFSEENIFWLDLVICLKKTNMTVNDIKRIIELSIQGDSTIDERKSILLGHKNKIASQIEELEESMKKIEKKIDFYDGKESC